MPSQTDQLETYRADPARLMTDAKLPPDDWQRDLLRSRSSRVLMLTARQSGKSTTAGFLALRTALLEPASTVLLVSPSLRQSAELFRRTMDGYTRLGQPIPLTAESVLRAEFANRSRIISLPGSEGTVRGYTANLVILDEAARIADSLYFAIRPMLATTGGTLVCLSTAFAKSGFMYEAWTGSEKWHRIRVTAEMNPRVSKEFLAEERRALGARVYAMEYLCEFGDSVAAVFSTEDIRAASSAEVKPLFPKSNLPSSTDDSVRPLFSRG